MTRIHFDPKTSLIVLECRIEYRRPAIVRLAFDTGATTTIIRDKVLEKIGFDFAKVTARGTFGDASQTHLVPRVKLKSLALANAKIENLTVLAYTLPEEYGIDGILGLNFLKQFKITLNPKKGTLTLISL